jgi:hypothetical protein
VLTLGVAMASPLVATKTFEMVCSDGGPMKLIVVDQNGDVTVVGQHTLDCAMCLPASLPAPVVNQIAPSRSRWRMPLTPSRRHASLPSWAPPCRLAAPPRAPEHLESRA